MRDCALAIPTILEISTQVIFQRSGAQDWMWAAIWVFQTLTYVGVVLFATLLLSSRRPISHARERRFLLAAWVVVAFPTLVMVSNRLMLTDELSFAG